MLRGLTPIRVRDVKGSDPDYPLSSDYLSNDRVVTSRYYLEFEQIGPLLNMLSQSDGIVRFQNGHSARAIKIVPASDDLHTRGRRSASLLKSLIHFITYCGVDGPIYDECHEREYISS